MLSSFTKSLSIDSKNISFGEKFIEENDELEGWSDFVNYLIEETEEKKGRDNDVSKV